MTPRPLVPASLPDVDAVDVVDLFAIKVNRVSEFMAVAQGAPCLRLDGTRGKRVAELWRQLPEGQQARCHSPPFGVRFVVGGETILQASICWACNNIFGSDEAGDLHAEFDTTGAVARELFLLLAAASVPWTDFVEPGGTSYPQFVVSHVSDSGLFDRAAIILEERLHGTWTERLDGPDARYWDLAAGSGRITLHLEHYLGISLYPTDGSRADIESLALLMRACRLLVPLRPSEQAVPTT